MLSASGVIRGVWWRRLGVVVMSVSSCPLCSAGQPISPFFLTRELRAASHLPIAYTDDGTVPTCNQLASLIHLWLLDAARRSLQAADKVNWSVVRCQRGEPTPPTHTERHKETDRQADRNRQIQLNTCREIKKGKQRKTCTHTAMETKRLKRKGHRQSDSKRQRLIESACMCVCVCVCVCVHQHTLASRRSIPGRWHPSNILLPCGAVLYLSLKISSKQKQKKQDRGAVFCFQQRMSYILHHMGKGYKILQIPSMLTAVAIHKPVWCCRSEPRWCVSLIIPMLHPRTLDIRTPFKKKKSPLSACMRCRIASHALWRQHRDCHQCQDITLN